MVHLLPSSRTNFWNISFKNVQKSGLLSFFLGGRVYLDGCFQIFFPLIFFPSQKNLIFLYSKSNWLRPLVESIIKRCETCWEQIRFGCPLIFSDHMFSFEGGWRKFGCIVFSHLQAKAIFICYRRPDVFCVKMPRKQEAKPNPAHMPNTEIFLHKLSHFLDRVIYLWILNPGFCFYFTGASINWLCSGDWAWVP